MDMFEDIFQRLIDFQNTFLTDLSLPAIVALLQRSQSAKLINPALRPSNMCANLQSLSVEIVQLLACNLQRPELCSLRLVCRSLHEKSWKVFTKLLNVVKTDLSAQSLEKLPGIANSDHLAPHLHTLRFSSDQEGALGRGFKWSRNTSGGLADPLADAYFMLQEILKNQLVNCRSFYINNYDEVGTWKENSRLTPWSSSYTPLSSTPTSGWFLSRSNRKVLTTD